MFSTYLFLFVIQFSLRRTSQVEIFSPSCKLFEEYRSCGPACPISCDTIHTEVCCEVKCVSGCFCRDGYMLLSNRGHRHRRCVPINDCPKPGVLEFGNLTITVVESAKTVVIVILRKNGSAGEITVRWRTVEGSAKERSDFVPSSDILVFPDGVTYGTITVQIVDDTVREADESFTVVLSDPTNKAEIHPQWIEGVTVVIKDDDMRPGYIELLQPVVTVPESIKALELQFVRRGGADGSLRIGYRTVDGTASSSSDYVSRTGELVFPEGVTLQKISIEVINDDITEPYEESFRVELFDPTGDDIGFRKISGGITSTIITIRDDDMKPGYLELKEDSITTREDRSNLTVTIVRLGGVEGILLMKFQTKDGTALAGSDYQSVLGDLVFNHGEKEKMVTILILNDDAKEFPEIFHLEIYDIKAGPETLNFISKGSRYSTRITIIDDDLTPGYVEMVNPYIDAPESTGSVPIYLRRLGGSDGDLTVKYITVAGTALAESDFTPTSGVIVFNDRETSKVISIPIMDDKMKEPAKTFQVQLLDDLNPQLGQLTFRRLGSKLTTTITIKDDDEPGYVEMEKPFIEVSETIGSVKIGVQRLGGSTGELPVKYIVVAGTAIAELDFSPTSGVLLFKDGETRHVISIPIMDDKRKEPVKTFQVKLLDVNPQLGQLNYRTLGSKFATIVSIKDDDEPGYVEMEAPSIEAPESAGSVPIYLIRLGGSDGDLPVRYLTVAGTALAGSDFRPTSGVTVFKHRETRKVIYIPIIDDKMKEPVKTFQVQLLDDVNGQLGELSYRRLGSKITTIVSIVDNDIAQGLVGFDKKSIIVEEGAGMVKIIVRRYGGKDGKLPVKYKTVPGTAIATADFINADEELIFDDGVDELSLSIRIVEDKIKEPTETFTIILYEPVGVQTRRLGEITSLLVTITDNDNNPGVFEFQNVRMSVKESVQTLSVTIIRIDGLDLEVSLQIRTISGTATEGIDYNPPPLTVIFPVGISQQIVQIRIIDDDIKENDEEFFIGLFNPTNGGILGRNKQLTVVIIDDDDPSIIRFQRRSGTFRESDPVAEIPVIRENALNKRVSVYWTIVDQSTKAGEDYRRSSGDLLTFDPGQRMKSIRIELVDDTQVENSEFFDVVLRYPSKGAVLGVPSRFSVELLDNDVRASTLPPVSSVPLVIHQVSFRLQSIRVKESCGEVVIPIARSGSLIPISVSIVTQDGSAVGERDYKRTRGLVRFQEGDVEVSIRVRIIDDSIPEPEKTFTVVLFNPSVGLTLGLKVVTIIIEDDDGVASDGVVSNPSRPVPSEAHKFGLNYKCPEHLILKICANTCPPTCGSISGKVPCSFSGSDCIRGCFCPEPLVKESESSERCIRRSQCLGGSREVQPDNARPFGLLL